MSGFEDTLTYSLLVHNKYIFRSRISEAQFRKFLHLFIIDMEATKITVLTGLNRNTVNRMIRLLRIRLARLCEQEYQHQSGVFELDECYLGARRVRGKRGRGTKGKTILFGLYERISGKAYVRIVSNVKRQTLMKVIKSKITYDSTIYTDGFHVYDSLLEQGFQNHSRVLHGENEFVRGVAHVNGMEGFWSFLKTRLSKFRGLGKKAHIFLHVKECEYRFNHRGEDLYTLILTNLRNSPIN